MIVRPVKPSTEENDDEKNGELNERMARRKNEKNGENGGNVKRRRTTTKTRERHEGIYTGFKNFLHDNQFKFQQLFFTTIRAVWDMMKRSFYLFSNHINI